MKKTVELSIQIAVSKKPVQHFSSVEEIHVCIWILYMGVYILVPRSRVYCKVREDITHLMQ